MLKAIIFDFDGVVVDTEPLHCRAFLEAVRPMGIAFDFARYMRDYVGYDDRDGFRAICRDHHVPLSAEQLAGLIADKAAAFGRIVADGVAPIPGTVELIEEAARVMPIALCSGALLHDIALILPKLGDSGIREKFTTIVTADDVARSKPDPECYRLAAARLKIAPENCLAIEDTPAGIAAAKDAGLRAMGLAIGFTEAQLSRADRVVPDLQGSNVEQLRRWFDGPVR